MAVFDSNLMLRNTTQTVSSNQSGGQGLFTGNWLTLGTGGGPAQGYAFRAVVQTAASNTDALNIIYEFSDDASTVKESITVPLTGTQLGAPAVVSSTAPDILTVYATKRTYVRARISITGTIANFGLVTIGVDGGDFSAAR